MTDDYEEVEEAEERPWWERPTYLKTGKSEPKRSRNDYVTDLWADRGWGDDDELWTDDEEAPSIGRSDYYYGRRRRSGHAVNLSTQQKAVVAHGMVQTFVDAFSASDFGYRVTFDPAVSTAGTDFRTKRVVISPAPVFDKSLTAAQAGLILTAMAVHEVSHVKYGQNTAAFVTKTFAGTDQLDLARKLSNLLDDVRIEQLFSKDYPGYSDVFAPTLEYVARDSKGKVPSTSDLFKFAVGAVRYADHLTYNSADLRAERDWWQDWAKRGASQNGGKHHVAAIREAIERIGSQVQLPEEGQGAQGDEQDDEQQGQSGGSSQSGDEQQDQQGSTPSPSTPSDEQREGNPDGGSDGASDGNEDDAEAEPEGEGPQTEDLPTCSTDGVAQSAKSRGINITEDDERAIQKAVDEAETLEGDDEYGKGEVLQSPAGVAKHANTDYWSSRYYHGGNTRGSAAAAIRAAFMRSRSGHTTYSGGRKHGHLSGRDLNRIAFNDTRLFEKRTAPSPGKFLVWVMVDCSSSMAGNSIRDAADVAQAFVEATSALGNVRAAVWGWSSPFKAQQQGLARFGAVKVWDNARPSSDVQRLVTLPMGGTPDASVMAWAINAIRKEATHGEQPIILFVSDGQGYRLRPITDKAQRIGVRVVGVNIDSGARESQLLDNYGPGNYTTWPGSIEKVARPLGNLVGKAITPKAG